MKKLSKYNYELQRYLSENYYGEINQEFSDKTISDLKSYLSLNTEFSRFDSITEALYLHGDDFMKLNKEGIEKLIEFYHAGQNFMTENNLPVFTFDYENKVLTIIKKYKSFNDSYVVVLMFLDNTFYVADLTSVEKGYDGYGTPFVQDGYFSFDYNFIEAISGKEIADKYDEIMRQIGFYKF